jgi:hypothetical protein
LITVAGERSPPPKAYKRSKSNGDVIGDVLSAQRPELFSHTPHERIVTVHDILNFERSRDFL